MNILILGGTGSIGQALTELLKNTAWNVYVTTRTKRENVQKQFHIKYVDDIEMFYNIWNPYQIKYDCNIDRRFDNSKINRATNNKLQYTLVAEGINKCLKKFIESPEWRNINWKLNFWMDNITGEKTKIWDADGLKEKARYVKYCIKK